MNASRFWTIASPEMKISPTGDGGGKGRDKEKSNNGGRGGGKGGWSGRGGQGGRWGKGGGGGGGAAMTPYMYFNIDITLNNGSSIHGMDEVWINDASDVNMCLGTQEPASYGGSSKVAWVDGYNGVYQRFGKAKSGFTDGWFANATTGWTQIVYDVPQDIVAAVYMSRVPAYSPKQFRIIAADNSGFSPFVTAYQTTDDVTGWTNWNDQKTFTWDSIGAYRWWRLDIQENSGDPQYAGLYNIRYLGADGNLKAPLIRNVAIGVQTNNSDADRPYKMATGSALSPDTETGWLSTARATENIRFSFPYLVQAKSFTMWPPRQVGTWYTNRMPKDFTIGGSLDGISYTELFSVTGFTDWVGGESREFTLIYP